MTIQYLLILILPVILHIKGNLAILIFLIMNSIINLLMQYTREQMKVLGFFIDNQALIDEQMKAGLTEEEAFEEYNIDEEETKEWIPKPIDLALKISMAINLIAIVLGIVNLREHKGTEVLCTFPHTIQQWGHRGQVPMTTINYQASWKKTGARH